MIQTIFKPGQRDPVYLTETKEDLAKKLSSAVARVNRRIEEEVMPEINEDYPPEWPNYCRVDEDGTEVSRDMAIARLTADWKFIFCGVKFTVEQLKALTEDSFVAKPESHTEEYVEGRTVLVEYETDGYQWRPSHTPREEIRKAIIDSITLNKVMPEVLCDYFALFILNDFKIKRAIHEHLDIEYIVRNRVVPILSANPKLEQAVVNYCTEFVLGIYTKMRGIAKEII